MKSVDEWSNAFDVKVAEYIRLKRFGFSDPIEFDEYEKSLFLTEAQDDTVKELYSSSISAFENTEQARRELDSLVTTVYCDNTEGTMITDKYHHTSFRVPNDCLYIIYEQAKYQSEDKCLADVAVDIIPVTHDEYQRVVKNPFRGPSQNKALRLDISKLQTEIVSIHPVKEYFIRYLKYPEPIVLCNLTDEGVSINGMNIPNTCKLNESIHSKILDRAVRLALSSRISNDNAK